MSDRYSESWSSQHVPVGSQMLNFSLESVHQEIIVQTQIEMMVVEYLLVMVGNRYVFELWVQGVLTYYL